jgi:hypothetical protein
MSSSEAPLKPLRLKKALPARQNASCLPPSLAFGPAPEPALAPSGAAPPAASPPMTNRARRRGAAMPAKKMSMKSSAAWPNLLGVEVRQPQYGQLHQPEQRQRGAERIAVAQAAVRGPLAQEALQAFEQRAVAPRHRLPLGRLERANLGEDGNVRALAPDDALPGLEIGPDEGGALVGAAACRVGAIEHGFDGVAGGEVDLADQVVLRLDVVVEAGLVEFEALRDVAQAGRAGAVDIEQPGRLGQDRGALLLVQQAPVERRSGFGIVVIHRDFAWLPEIFCAGLLIDVLM